MIRVDKIVRKYVHEDFNDHLYLNVKLVDQDVTNKTSTLHLDAVLYNENLKLGNTGTYYVRTYINGVVEPRLTQLFYTTVNAQPEYSIFEDKEIVIQHSTTDFSDVDVNIAVKINFTDYHWEDPNDSDVIYDIHEKFEDGLKAETSFTLPKITDRVTVTSAPAFSDQENYTILYSSLANVTYDKIETGILFRKNNVTKELVYRDITDVRNPSYPNNSYTFQLTDEELKAIRAEFYDTSVLSYCVFIRSTLNGVEEYDDSGFAGGQIISEYPSILNPVVKQANSTIVELTGDENVMVKGEGMAEFQYEPVVYREANIERMSITNGTEIVSDMPQGVIDNPVSNIFTIFIEDSRGLTRTKTIEKPMIDYIKPTCVQKVTNEHSGEVDSIIKVELSGNFFNGSFGAVENELVVELRHTQEDGEMGEWINLTDGLVPIIKGNRYTFNVTVSGFIYNQSYTFQSRVSDKLHTVITDSYTTTIMPLFDWGAEDFNFNLPINMYSKTVLRHNKEAGNTVLSADQGHLYLRPNGTDDTTNETIFYPDGRVNFSGDITINGETVRGADYVVSCGEVAMGTNGTWYWTRWASGKAECYGERNFGRMAITNTWGSLYRSASYTQSLPTNLFNDAPEVININFNHGTGGGWIARDGNSVASTSDTGSFVVVRPASATIDVSMISFHVIGRWAGVS